MPKRPPPPSQETPRPEGGKEGPTPRRPGLPAPENVVAERRFVSPKGRRYRILRTTEKDAYEEAADPAAEPGQDAATPEGGGKD